MNYVGNVAQMKAAENKLFLKGVTPIELMGSVGRFICDNLSVEKKILIICGKGNNGGDGYAAACFLSEMNKDVTLLCVNEKRTESSDYYYQKCLKNNVKCIYRYSYIDFSQYDVIVDCLYGIGFHGNVSCEDAALIKAVNSCSKKVISIDIPSGLDADNGTTECAVIADEVWSVGFHKYGLFLNSGKDHAKKVSVIPLEFDTDGLGLIPDVVDFTDFLRKRKNDSHKGSYGYVSIFGGSINYSGAVKLANLACLAASSGCGVVRLAVPERIMDWVAPALLESTIFCEDDLKDILNNVAAVGIGCGWGRKDDRVKLLSDIFSACHSPLILDADGLYAWKKSGLIGYNSDLIITPHYAEMAYLTDLTVAEVRKDPVGVARSFSQKNNCITVLKGPSTVITDGKDVFLTNRGCSGMATAGSGDVLLGIMTSVVGQKFNNILLSVAYATFINGISGEIAQDESTDIAMTSRDTVDHIKSAIKFLRKSCGIN